MSNPYPIYVFNSSIQQQTIIDDYEYLKWNIRYRKADDLELVINRYKNNVDYLASGNIIAFYRNGSWRAGFIETKKLELTQEGKISENWSIKGRGLDGLMCERIALYATDSGTGYDSQSGNAETLMRHYVDVNCISSSVPDRNYSLLELEADQLRGSNVYYDARFQKLDSLLEEIGLAGSLGWNIVLDVENKKYLFRILKGLDRSFGNGVNSVVSFSPEFGNIKLLGYEESRINSKNVALVAGQGEANSRVVQTVAKDGSSYSDMERREIFIDARDLDTTDKLTQRGNERLEELGIDIFVEFENLNGGPFNFEEHFNIGDIVSVNYPDIVSFNGRIIEVCEEITKEEGITDTLIVGREYPDLINILKLQNKNVSAEIRR